MALEQKILRFTNYLKAFVPSSLVEFTAKAFAFSYYVGLKKCIDSPKGDVDKASMSFANSLTEHDTSPVFTLKELREAVLVGAKIVNENQSSKEHINFEFLNNELLKLEYDELLAMLNYSFPNSIHDDSTPEGLIDLVLLLANKFIRNKESATDMTCGEGSFLLKASKEYKHIEGVEINKENALIAKMRLHANLIDGQVRNADCFEDSWHHQIDENGSNLVFSEFPWKMVVKDPRQREIMLNCNANRFILNQGDTAEYFYLSAMMNYLKKKDSVAISVVPLSILSNLADKNVRAHMIKTKYVKAVITLPQSIFSRTNISTAIIVLSNCDNEKVALFDGTSYFKKDSRKLNYVCAQELFNDFSNAFDSNECMFSEREIAKRDYSLSPAAYSTKIEKTMPNATELCELADIFTGWQVSSAKLEMIHKNDGSGTRLLQMSNVVNGSIDNKLERYDIPESTIEKFKVKNGDVVISTKSLKVKSAVVDLETKSPIVAAGSIIVIRPKEKKLDPYYLVAFFESDLGKQILSMYQTGNIIPNLSITNVKKLPIPGLSYEEQVNKGYEYRELRDLIAFEKERLRALELKVNVILDSLWDKKAGD